MSKTKAPERQETKRLTAKVLNNNGQALGRVSLPKEIFAVTVNEQLLAQAIHVYRARQRQGTIERKSRGEVSGSTRKIYRQKGTGRARHGDRKAPIFVGGGLTHPPRPIGAKPVLGKKMRRQALFSALSNRFRQNLITIIDDLSKLPAKTKALFKLLENVGGQPGQKTILLVLPERQENVYLAGRNIPKLTIIQAPLLNAFEVLKSERLILLKQAIPILVQLFGEEKEAEVEVKTKKEKKPESVKPKRLKKKPIREVTKKRRKPNRIKTATKKAEVRVARKKPKKGRS